MKCVLIIFLIGSIPNDLFITAGITWLQIKAFCFCGLNSLHGRVGNRSTFRGGMK